jgi:UDP-N-acetylmuramoylalanine--D-glutamate ligase
LTPRAVISGRFAGERAVVVGLGASGLAAARVLAEEGAAVLVTERRAASTLGRVEEVEGLHALGVRIVAHGHRVEHLEDATLVVASPGVAEHAPVMRWAEARGIPVWSELELGAQLCAVPYVAITGTNGKTTTTEMIAAAFREAGVASAPCGNIGYQFSLAVREEYEALVVEASSFQLRYHRSFRPRVSVLLNLSPDHLDWHGSFDAYAAAKARIFELQGEGDVHVGSRDDPVAADVSSRAPCPTVWFTAGRPADGEVGYEDGELVSRLEGSAVLLGRPASHHAGFQADAAAAGAAALAFGLPPEAVAAGIASVGPLPHRGEVVARVRNVRFVDDSKATNPHAAVAALAGMHDAVLVAGGQAKGVDLSPLAALTPSLAGVVVLGEAAPQIAALFEGRLPVRRARSIEEAARMGLELAPAGGTVILAPACASLDMFADYRERGERFAAAAVGLAEEVRDVG